MSRMRITLGLATVLITMSATGYAAANSSTSVSVHDPVDGTNNKLDILGSLRFVTPTGWTRSTSQNASTAKFTVAQGNGCRATVHVSTRAVASRQVARTRVQRATSGVKITLINQGARAHGGWWRLVQLPPGRKHANGADLYGLGTLRVTQHDWVDVRAYAFLPGCSADAIRRGVASRTVAQVLRNATIHARVLTKASS